MEPFPNFEMDLHKIPIQAFTSKTREKLACMLNERKLTPTDPNKFRRDYRGLAELMGLKVYGLTNNTNHVANLLEKSRHTIGQFQEFLEQIDRFDVLDDCRELFYRDAVAHLEQLNSPLSCQNKEDYLTIDDIMESKRKYDAFLLYADDDIDFAAKIVTNLESTEFNLKICVKDRLLGGAVFEHSAIMQLISQRCRRLIVLLSDEFVKSDRDIFYLEFARHMGWVQGNESRFIIPVAYKPYKQLPEHHNVYWILHYNRHNILVSFWETLHRSIVTPPASTSFSSRSVPIKEPQLPAPHSLNGDCIHVPRGECSLIESPLKVEESQSLEPSPDVEPKLRRRKSVKSAVNKLFKRVFKKKSKNLSAAYCA